MIDILTPMLPRWRAWKNEKQVISSFGFIDGDLVEQFLSLDTALRNEVVEGLEYTNDLGETVPCEAGVLTELIEGLSRIH